MSAPTGASGMREAARSPTAQASSVLECAGMYSLYLHIPFCRVRCAYCDFNTFAGLEDLIPRYMRALTDEVRQVAAGLRAAQGEEGDALSLHTIYLGGGTPSLVPLPDLRSLLREIREGFAVASDAEVTMEANPGTVDAAYLEGLRELGVNRLSLGVQSADPRELAKLDRLHTFEQAGETVGQARLAGFDNLNLDLIYGLPGQAIDSWMRTLESSLGLLPDHLSLYALTLEEGTPMHRRVQRGDLPAPDGDLAADMYEYAARALRTAGFVHYEISNWCKRGVPPRACLHNLQYWRNLPYLGMGAGAHGFALGWRYANLRSPQDYIDRISSGASQAAPFSAALAERTRVDRPTEERDMLLLGLRLVEEGVGLGAFQARFGRSLMDAFGSEVDQLCRQGLLELLPDRIRLTPRAYLVANQVFLHFV
jgi:oxygen-independent coproporphyrinogen-3 oxidase